MKLSAKGRYALSAMIYLAEEEGRQYSVAHMANEMNISKIYLEQVMSALKGAGLVTATAGAAGGYRLGRPAKDITVLDILTPTDPSLLANPEMGDSPRERAVEELVTNTLKLALEKHLSQVTLRDLTAKALSYQAKPATMFYI